MRGIGSGCLGGGLMALGLMLELEVLIKAWDKLVNILSGALVIDDMEWKGKMFE